MRSLKNSHNGERCFIVATGPSLTLEDLELIKGEYCFSMNSIVNLFDKTNFRPNFFAIQDEYVYNKIEDKISDYRDELKTIYISNSVNNLCHVNGNKVVFNLDYLNHKYNKKKISAKISNNCAYKVYDGYSITFSLLQIAIYMGFKKIYLLGNDCNYDCDKTHVIDYGFDDPNKEMLGMRMILAYEKVKNDILEKNIEVFNCTRGGMLEVFPRCKLEDILS